MRHTLIEGLYVAAGVLVAVAITWAAAWAYPLGRQVIWTVGAVAVAVVLGMNVQALREAWARDQSEGGPRG